MDFHLTDICSGSGCTFNHLIILAKNLINALVVLSTILATAVFIFAGFKLMTSGGDEGAMKNAKEMLLKVLKGYVWILAAWLLVYTIMNALVKPEFNTVLGKP